MENFAEVNSNIRFARVTFGLGVNGLEFTLAMDEKKICM